MNVFMHLKNKKGSTELITPPLNGLILLDVILVKVFWMLEEDLAVSEREITMDELIEVHQDNRLLEMFGAGTAAIVCPVERIIYEEKT